MDIGSYLRRGIAYWRVNGSAALTRAVARRIKARLSGAPPGAASPSGRSIAFGAHRGPWSPADLDSARFPNLRAIRTFSAPGERRVTVVTDSVGKSSLFGGVGTALLLGASMANRLDAQLRLVTRTERPSPRSVEAVLSAYGLKLLKEPQFQLASIDDPAAEMDVVQDEIFLTTSWWTTHSVLRGVRPESVVYLLQEDERMFYPHGDDRVRCEQLLARSDIRYVVNTRLLLDHLLTSGLAHLGRSAVHFEPAFPPHVYRQRPKSRAQGGRKQFFFYARPQHERNLFYLGLQVVDQALKRGVLALEEWEVVLVGKDLPRIDFGPGVQTRYVEGLEWGAYAELCSSIDLALSLMYTPHPSYPPLDLAASGAVVVTNRYGNKQSLASYSRNIVCADLDVESLVAGLAEGVALAGSEQRDANLRSNALSLDWNESFEPVLQRICGA